MVVEFRWSARHHVALVTVRLVAASYCRGDKLIDKKNAIAASKGVIGYKHVTIFRRARGRDTTEALGLWLRGGTASKRPVNHTAAPFEFGGGK
jgi:hypothetical protein